jgi:hypothetical protein
MRTPPELLMSAAVTGRARLRDSEHDVLDVLGQRERQRLEVADDLVDVFDDTGNGLVLVDDAVDAERPTAAPRSDDSSMRRIELPSV